MDTALAPHRGGTILGLGIIGLLSAFVFLPVGLAAWILGAKDLRAMEEGRMDPSGRTATQVGWVFGIAAMFMWVVAVCGTFVLLVATSGGTEPTRMQLITDPIPATAPR